MTTRTFTVTVTTPTGVDPCEPSEIAPLVRRYFAEAGEAVKVTVSDASDITAQLAARTEALVKARALLSGRVSPDALAVIDAALKE